MNDKSRKIAGTVLILMGLVFLVDQFSVRWFGIGWIFANLWPLIFVFLGINFWGNGKRKPAMVMLFLGGMFLLSNLVSWSIWSLIWPMFFIFIGITILFDDEKTVNSAIKGEENTDLLNDVLLFWGMDKKIISKDFKGGDIVAIFGGGTLDLSGVSIAKGGAELNIVAIFGGLKVILSKDAYQVDAKGSGVFGGWSNSYENGAKKTAKTLKLDGVAIFGGVEVSN